MALARRRFDCLILGAGGAGLNAALRLSNADLRVAVVSKVFRRARTRWRRRVA